MSEEYYTHREYTKGVLKGLPKGAKVLELGCGYGSSTLFHDFAKNNPECRIYSLEDNPEWIKKIQSEFALKNYAFVQVENWGLIDYSALFEKKWDFVFVDHGIWEERIRAIDELSDKTSIFLLHDYDYYNKIKGAELLSIDSDSFFSGYLSDFKLTAFTEVMPPTLLFEKVEYLRNFRN